MSRFDIAHSRWTPAMYRADEILDEYGFESEAISSLKGPRHPDTINRFICSIKVDRRLWEISQR